MEQLVDTRKENVLTASDFLLWTLPTPCLQSQLIKLLKPDTPEVSPEQYTPSAPGKDLALEKLSPQREIDGETFSFLHYPLVALSLLFLSLR